MIRTQQQWVERYKEKGALWFHDGNMKRPHALLTSGNHSNGFFNSEIVMEDSALLDTACSDLVCLLREANVNLLNIDRVVGPAMGAITLADGIARHISFGRQRICLRAYTEKDTSSANSKMMVFKRTAIHPTELVLLVEDVLTTGSSVGLAATAVAAAYAYVAPFLAVLVNRSNQTQISNYKIISLIHQPMPIWMPAECPLCKQGSEAIRPKGKENWERLNKTY
jgi:orotate phosphoribosyltransferase